MNDLSSSNNTPSAPLNRREMRQQRRELRRESRGVGGLGWLAGLLLVVLGLAFLMQNMGYFSFPTNNWWALFIFIPALGAFERVMANYRANGNRFGRSVGAPLVGGVVLTLVALNFLFGFDWIVVGPVLIILAGVGILLNAMLPGKE